MTLPFSFRTALILIGMGVVSAFSSCEKVSPYMDKAKAILDGEPAVQEAEPVKSTEPIPPPPAPVKMEPVINKEARVSVLGYHDFTEGTSTNDMIINIEEFRREMQAIRDAQLPVISMKQFLDWKHEKADIPAQCVMITIDDGWKAVHTLAMKVLKEFDYPFTVFLYKNYINIGGRSLTHQEVREIAANGGTLSSHTVSHQNLSARGGRSQEAYDTWLRNELAGSIEYLEQTYGDTGAVQKTLAYPFGIYNDRVLELAKEAGYEAAFTVNGKKTNWTTDDLQIGRYVVHGKTLANFDPALNFGGGNETSAGRSLLTAQVAADGTKQDALVTVFPEANATIDSRLPKIEIDFSRLEGLDPSSLVLRVSGFGRVSPTYDPATSRLSYQTPEALRSDTCTVQISFRHGGSTKVEMIAWTFRINLSADYLSRVNDKTKSETTETEATASQ